MNGRTFSQNPRKRGKKQQQHHHHHHHHQIKQFSGTDSHVLTMFAVGPTAGIMILV